MDTSRTNHALDIKFLIQGHSIVIELTCQFLSGYGFWILGKIFQSQNLMKIMT